MNITTKHRDRTPYVWSLVIVIGISLMFMVIILLIRPEQDPVSLIGEILKPVVPTVAAVFAYLKSQEVHLQVNSRLDQLLEKSVREAHLTGMLDGLNQERDRHDAIDNNKVTKTSI